MMLPALPSDAGHSQSMSTPSKTPNAEPGPPAGSPPICGRLPLMNRSRQEETKACRDAAVRAASEKYFEYVQPPIEMSTLSPGYLALSSLSWLKLPFSRWSQVSPTPSTLDAASNDFW